MAALFDQTYHSSVYTYETLASAASSMDDAAHLSAYPDENLFGFFSSSLPAEHSSSLSLPSYYEATDPYSDLWATTEEDLYAGAHYGAQEVDTPVTPETGNDSSPAQIWAPKPRRMLKAHWLSDGWDGVTDVAHAPAAIGSPVHTGEIYHDSLTVSMDAAANCVPVRAAQKRRANGDMDEGRTVKRPRHTADPTPERDMTPPDPRTGLAQPGETLSQSNSKYKTIGLEENPRERQNLASVPPAETGASTQQGPSRPTARATKAAPELKPEVPGEDGRKGRGEKADTSGKKKVACAWPARLKSGKMCDKGYGRDHDMFRHVQSEHLRIPYECPKCGTYILRERKKHQRSNECARARRWTELGRELRGQSALVDKGVTRVLKGERLVDDEVRSILETIRRLIEAGRSQPDDVVDGIDGWMERHGKVWLKVVDIAHAHAPP